MTRIDQFLVNLVPGDAISNQALFYKQALTGWGYKSDIYALHVAPELRDQGNHFSAYTDPDRRSVNLFHYSIHSDVSEFVLAQPAPLILLYHNVTPYQYLVRINQHSARMAWLARKHLPRFSSRTTLALAVSEYNRRELAGYGFSQTDLMPIILDRNLNTESPEPALLSQYDNAKGTNLLFVGRVVPNKRHEDVIRIFEYYKQHIDPQARLFFVGPTEGYETYHRWLIRQISTPDVHITGSVSEAELLAYYQISDIFVCMSEHEGFCVPLLESMHHDLPIVAYDGGAVRETLGDSGILVQEKCPPLIAELVARIANNEALRNCIVSGQRKRLADFDPQQLVSRLKTYVEMVAE